MFQLPDLCCKAPIHPGLPQPLQSRPSEPPERLCPRTEEPVLFTKCNSHLLDCSVFSQHSFLSETFCEPKANAEKNVTTCMYKISAKSTTCLDETIYEYLLHSIYLSPITSRTLLIQLATSQCSSQRAQAHVHCYPQGTTTQNTLSGHSPPAGLSPSGSRHSAPLPPGPHSPFQPSFPSLVPELQRA